jgi:hypothetical protein
MMTILQKSKYVFNVSVIYGMEGEEYVKDIWQGYLYETGAVCD